ncbi:MBL fold metallo-hydrolase [Rhodoferax sp.]|uniref:MBL fold metallo-hydrolase n=1 Tax=Rhodoferax sp. TaxID=50421 RepID=UPI002617FE59|nr:MBL fold metallo-hydrolase [Rhodoferax sp.]MDD2809105.1 MBL fold metallo-hydrolase [Rhodoferax sp.]MDD5480640.1 MBL fold metallo-hydrolase [Rhodoferax sp.]
MNTLNLPPGITLFERGWLSSNNILLHGTHSTALVDSGYASHAPQTLALLHSALKERTLDTLVNTHLHSDHCGGNAALQARYSALHTLIPPGHAPQVAAWDATALSYTPTGQVCPRFGFNATLQPGSSLELGGQHWQVHAAPGHDTHSVILFEPSARVLISADALWQNGFGVVFPELDGSDAFAEVAQTLDLIETLQPTTVIPGHGSAFTDVAEALARARRKLQGFVQDPAKHRRYAAKVLLKFKLLEVQSLDFEALLQWAQGTALLLHLHQTEAASSALDPWLEVLVNDLVRAQAAAWHGRQVCNV